MHWRDYYPTHELAERDARLGDIEGGLGKIKLSMQQKAAIAAARADAKTQKIAAKAKVTVAKLAAKQAKIDNKTAIANAKRGATVAKYDAKASAVTPVDVPTVATSSSTDLSPMSAFAPSGGGSGGSAPAPSSPDAAAAASDSPIPMPVILIGAGILAFVLFMRK